MLKFDFICLDLAHSLGSLRCPCSLPTNCFLLKLTQVVLCYWKAPENILIMNAERLLQWSLLFPGSVNFLQCSRSCVLTSIKWNFNSCAYTSESSETWTPQNNGCCHCTTGKSNIRSMGALVQMYTPLATWQRFWESIVTTNDTKKLTKTECQWKMCQWWRTIAS